MPTIGYNLNTPLASETPSVSQPKMAQNTNAVNDIIAVDHYPFSESEAGYHKKSTYVALDSDPGAVAGADIVYAKTVSGLIELFLERPSGSPIQLTAGTVTSTSNGSTFLPGGIIVKWGNFGFSDGSGVTSPPISFPTAFPNSFFSLSLLPFTSTPSQGVGSVSFSGTSNPSQFTAYRSNTQGTVTYFYIAIGN